MRVDEEHPGYKGSDYTVNGDRADCVLVDVKRKDEEIENLKTRLEKLEGDTVEVVRLCGPVLELEVAATARVEELASLRAKNVELIGLLQCSPINRALSQDAAFVEGAFVVKSCGYFSRN
uniref:Uncharacterized protein n=1 Tax=Tanacetum cinerariifolium TaxID=118510 RepID=A0A699KYB2_TANCI|nr:hypothetical protein [Tanacetum cinerariifolium]